MLAHDDSSDDDSDDDEDIQKMVSKRSRSISGDDLGDSFSFDQETANKKGWVDDIFENKDVNDDEEEDGNEEEDGTSSNDSESNNEDDDDNDDASDKDDSSGHDLGDISMRDWEQSDDDDLTLDAEEEEKEEEAEDVNEREIKLSKKTGEEMLSKKTGEEMRRKGSQDTQSGEVAGKMPPVKDAGLPFVIEAPNSLEELCSLLDNRSETEVIEAINRIRACNSIRLAAENRKKMQVCFCYST